MCPALHRGLRVPPLAFTSAFPMRQLQLGIRIGF